MNRLEKMQEFKKALTQQLKNCSCEIEDMIYYLETDIKIGRPLNVSSMIYLIADRKEGMYQEYEISIKISKKRLANE